MTPDEGCGRHALPLQRQEGIAIAIDAHDPLPESPVGPEAHGHRGVSGGWLRPSVFGAMDGLVTNVSLIAGVGAGGGSRNTLILTGMAGLVAGAFSMATGEYTSVRTQNEAVGAEVDIEALGLARHPKAEAAELAATFIAQGVEPELARQVVEQLSADPDQALRLHAREELGVDPHELPSPWTAAASGFVCFALGALLPLLPYLLGLTSLPLALGLSAVALFGAGALVARVTSRSVLYSGARQLTLGALAAGVTYLVGYLIGAGVVS